MVLRLGPKACSYLIHAEPLLGLVVAQTVADAPVEARCGLEREGPEFDVRERPGEDLALELDTDPVDAPEAAVVQVEVPLQAGHAVEREDEPVGAPFGLHGGVRPHTEVDLEAALREIE